MAALLALVLLGGGVAAAVALSREDSARTAAPETSTRTAGPTTETSPQQREPVARTTLAAVDLDTRTEPASVTLRLTGRALGAARIVVRDDDLTDGHGWFELDKAGIAARTKGAANGSLSVRVRNGKNVLRFDLRANPGAFDRFEARRLGGHAIALAFVTPAPLVTTRTETGTTPADTTPTKPAKPEKPQFGTR